MLDGVFGIAGASRRLCARFIFKPEKGLASPQQFLRLAASKMSNFVDILGCQNRITNVVVRQRQCRHACTRLTWPTGATRVLGEHETDRISLWR